MKCDVNGIEKDCVPGIVRIADAKNNQYTDNPNTPKRYFINSRKILLECDRSACPDAQLETDTCVKKCQPVSSQTLIEIKLVVNGKPKLISKDWNDKDWDDAGPRYEKTNDGFKLTSLPNDFTNDNVYYLIHSAIIPQDNGQRAYAVFDTLPQKIGGYKDWSSIEGLPKTYYYRNSSGSVGTEIKEAKIGRASCRERV